MWKNLIKENKVKISKSHGWIYFENKVFSLRIEKSFKSSMLATMDFIKHLDGLGDQCALL